MCWASTSQRTPSTAQAQATDTSYPRLQLPSQPAPVMPHSAPPQPAAPHPAPVALPPIHFNGTPTPTAHIHHPALDAARRGRPRKKSRSEGPNFQFIEVWTTELTGTYLRTYCHPLPSHQPSTHDSRFKSPFSRANCRACATSCPCTSRPRPARPWPSPPSSGGSRTPHECSATATPAL